MRSHHKQQTQTCSQREGRAETPRAASHAAEKNHAEEPRVPLTVIQFICMIERRHRDRHTKIGSHDMHNLSNGPAAKTRLKIADSRDAPAPARGTHSVFPVCGQIVQLP